MVVRIVRSNFINLGFLFYIEKMDSETEKKVEKELEKDVKTEVKKEIEERINKKLDKKLERRFASDIREEVQKRVKERMGALYSKTKKSTTKFKKEFKKHSIVAITAAFAFLIALSWRTPIQNLVNKLVETLGLSEKYIYFEFVSAVIITIVGVLVLMWISKWQAEE